MPSTTAAAILLLLFCTVRPLSSTSTIHSRRILHQPLLPLDSTPPSPPPAPSPPKLPFTSSSPENPPFFRSYPSPPSPPSPASLATFPANISSLAVPRASKPNSSSGKLIIAAVAAVIAAVAVVSIAVFLHLRRRASSTSFSESKTVRSDNCSTISYNQTPSTLHIPKLQRPSQSSAEFLYLGTLVNSHAPGGGAAFNGSSTSCNTVNTRKLDSPELRPLPPLIMQRQNFRHNAEAVSNKDDESEEFHSPKGSIKSSLGTGSASRRAFAALEVENFNGSTSNSSSSYSSSVPGSNSASPVRSVSSTRSPANNVSRINSMPKSPDLIEIQTIAPLPAQTVTPLPEMQGSLLHESASPSPPSSSSPDIYSRRSVESSPRISNASDQDVELPMRSNSSIQDNSSEIPAPPEIRGLMLPESTPTLPPSSPSPERCLTRNNSNVSDKNVESPEKISRISNSSDQDGESPVRSNSSIQESTTVFPTPPEMRVLVLESAPPLLPTPPSPDRSLTENEESSRRNSNVSDQNVESPLRISNSEQHDSTVISEFAYSLLAIPPSSERCLMRSEESSPRNSNASDRSVECPATSANSTIIIPTAPETLFPPERCSESEESSPRNSNVSDRNVESPERISSPAQRHTTAIPPSPELRGLVIPDPASPSGSSSPERYPGKIEELSPRISNASDEDMETPLSSPVQQTVVIPTKSEMEDLVLSSPRISIASDQAMPSPMKISSPALHELPLPVTSSSLERYSSCEESSLSILSDFDQNVDSPVRNGSFEEHNATVIPIPAPPPPPPPILNTPPPPVSVPPPPPPPPLPLSQAWTSPRTPTPTANQPIKPPALKNPLKPIAFESSTLISPIQLPSNDSQSVKNEEAKESPSKETECSSENVDSPPKPKLKPLHWDKVRASSDREMVWDQLKFSSFELNEEMIETLFVVNTSKPNPKETTRWQVLPSPGLDNGDRLLDPKKAQNIAILLKALHVTVDEVCEGLLEGNADILGTELLESLLKMAPTKEEERKLKEYKDDSPIKLGPAERFLKAVVDIPHAFRRVEAMLYVSNFESEVEYLKKSFATLETACEELRTSRVFLKLLEAVLRTGNRMNVGTNRGDAHAFKLDTLLKLVDVKGADGKTTLLHFVVQEMIRSEGARLSGEGPQDKNDDTKCRRLGLQVVSALSSELANVKKAAVMDAEMLSTDVSKLSKGIGNATEIVKLNEDDNNNKFSDNMNSFTTRAEEEICRIQAQESLALSLVKEITEYFHGNSALEEAHPFRIFMVVRDFLTILDRVCKEVGLINERTIVSSAHKFPVPVNPMLQQVSGPSHMRQCSSSDDESLPLNV